MDVNRFNSKLSSFVNAGLFKGTDVERLKKERGLTPQSGPQADTVEINFGRLAAAEQQGSGNSSVASLIQNISQMSLPEAQAQFQNPAVFAKLVEAGILE